MLAAAAPARYHALRALLQDGRLFSDPRILDPSPQDVSQVLHIAELKITHGTEAVVSKTS